MAKKPKSRQTNQTDEIPFSPELETEATAQRAAHGRGAQFLVSLYNGRSESSFAPSPPPYSSFTSDQRVLADRGVGDTADRNAFLCDITEDVAFDVGVAIFEASRTKNWKPEEGLDGLDQDISPEYALTLGAQIEQSLRMKAARLMTGGLDDYVDADSAWSLWVKHVFRLGQVSALHPNESDTSNREPNLWDLADLYNECVSIVTRFWPQVEQLARSLSHTKLNAILHQRLLETVFNQRFVEQPRTPANGR